MKKALVTGAAGFYGSHLVRYLLEKTDWHVVALCRADFAGDIRRIHELEEYQNNKDRVSIVWFDLRSPLTENVKQQIDAHNKVNYIFHVAASSHVDRSISDPMSFVYDNVVGTANILEYARQVDGLERFLYFSTDEVFGPAIGDGYKFGAWDRYHAGNPYAATKAGGEELCVAYHNTYGIPMIITHCMNIVGERQHPEKYLPKIIQHLLEGSQLPVHADKKCKLPGKRTYIYTDEVSEAVMFLINNGGSGEKYNIEGQALLDNLEFAQYVAKRLGKRLNYKLIPGHVARPGHDFEYALTNDALSQLGYKPTVDFWQALDKTIDWYNNNQHWILFDE